MIDLNHGSGPLFGAAQSHIFDVSEYINAAIDSGLAAKAEAEGKRTYLGASQLGDPCLRKLVYHYRGEAKREPEGRMRRIWQRGHWAEDRIIVWLRQAGFTIVDRDNRGKQLRFSQADGKISGGCDGVITAGPAVSPLPFLIPFPVLLELKCINSKSWNSLRKHGLEKDKGIYWAQIHLYMGYFKLTHCLFGAENADTEELLWHLIPYNIGEAQRASDIAVAVMRNGAPGMPLPPRISQNRDYYLCEWCDLNEVCWKE